MRLSVRDSLMTQTTLEEYIRSLGGEQVLTPSDVASLGSATQRVYELMCDGNWHTSSAIIEASGQREGLRRMRELRKHFTIDRRRCCGPEREFEYRLSEKGEEKKSRLWGVEEL